MCGKKQCLGTGRKRKGECSDGTDRVESFWTVCPYCYYVYEYEIVYQDCCLRCQNCRMAFQGVAMNGPLPQSVLVEGKKQYYCCLGLFKFYYFDPAGAVVNDEEKNICVNRAVIVVDETEDEIDVNGTLGRGEVEELREKISDQLSIIDEDDCAKQEIKQSQVQMVKTRGGIENKGRLMADHLKEKLDEEFKHVSEIKLGGLEFYEGDDDIYIGLSDL